MLPTTSRLPASVLASARVAPVADASATGKSNIAAGTLETTFESTKVTRKKGTGRLTSTPCAARLVIAVAGRPVDESAWCTTNSPTKSTSSSQSTSPSLVCECMVRLMSKSPATPSATSSRGV